MEDRAAGQQIRQAVGHLGKISGDARRLAAQIDEALGGSATAADRTMITALNEAARSARDAQQALNALLARL